MAAKHLPLPRRFAAAVTEDAYAQLRAINACYGLSNNYLLSILLERLYDFSDAKKLDATFRTFIAEYGAPKPGATMKKVAGKRRRTSK